MKGDKFREMAARCGELPDSVMAVPGLEYVGEKPAQWEALCMRASRWCAFGPTLIESSEPPEWPSCAHYYHNRRFDRKGSFVESSCAFAGLALFARLMATVMREE